MSGALFRAQQQRNTKENGVFTVIIIFIMIINKLQLQVKSLTVNKNRVSENHCNLQKITVAVAQCERALNID